MKLQKMYVDSNGKLRINQQLKFEKYKHEVRMSSKEVLEKVLEKLVKLEKYEECVRIKKLKESLDSK